MPGGTCPPNIVDEFIADCRAGLSRHELADKYGRHKRTIGEWKRKLRADGHDLDPITEPYQPNRHRVEFSESGNYAEASSQSERIKTLDQLLEAAEVDLDVWKVYDGPGPGWGVKKWEVGAKIKEGHLRYADGGIEEGYLEYKGLGVTDLWSVWAKFIRRQLEPLQPVIRPVECTVTFEKPEAPERRGVKCGLAVFDPHFGFSREIPDAKLIPFHDRRALDIVVQIAAHLQPERIDIGGDILDLVNWTDKFLRSPRFEYTTQAAILEAHRWFRRLREACPKSKIRVHPGNHDDRMRRAIMTHLRAAYGLKPADEMDLPPALSPQRLLAVHTLGIEWLTDYPDDQDWINPGLRIEHGDVARQAPGATARAIVENSQESVLFGHIHRRERASKTYHGSGGANEITAYCPACVCRIDGAVPGRTKRQNWQQGFARIEYTKRLHTVNDIEIRDGRAVCDGRVWKGRHGLAELRRDMPDWNW